MVCPVTQRASGEARNIATSATSSGVPSRPKGLPFRMRLYSAGSSVRRFYQDPPGTSMDPGATAFTRMPSGANIAAWEAV